MFTHGILGYRDLHFWLFVGFFVLVCFFIQFFVNVLTRILLIRLKDFSKLTKHEESMAMTHFPLFRTFIHKIIKPFNHKIKILGYISCSD